jgi:non-canonical purine NTP pyrophosphatase (RdgB/HAM1 family)
VSAISADDATNLFEIIEARNQLSSTIITSQLPVKDWYDYLQNNTIADAILDRIVNSSRRIKAEKGLDMIIVDYLQLMTTSKNYDSMVNQVTEISRSLKSLAKELDVPVIALSQLSRAVESRGGKPRLSDLRDSGSIEQDADVVMFIHREDKGKSEIEQTNIAEILIEKHRNGPTGAVELYFDAKATDQEWIEYFLKRMEKEQNRRAAFVCCLAYIDEQNQLHLFEGRAEGTITHELEAEYLPGLPLSACFKPYGFDRVFSALSVEEKNQISHRGRALMEFRRFLEEGGR